MVLDLHLPREMIQVVIVPSHPADVQSVKMFFTILTYNNDSKNS